MFFKMASSALLIFCLVASSQAAMTISGTRIIFPGNEKEVNVRTNNKGDNPSLVQVWVDDGNANADVNSIKTPFMVTPPVYRVEPGKGQSVRVIYNGMALPQDRESVFWFNMLEVPPVMQNAEKVDRLELAFRTRIKIFYRPKSLSSSGVGEVDKIKWEVLGNNTGIRVTNPTPYYLSFDSADVQLGGKAVALNTDMVAPFSSKDFLLKNKGSVAGLTGVTFRLLNDFGSAYKGQLNFSNGKELVLQHKK